MNLINNVLFASIQDNLGRILSDGLPIMVAGMMGIFVVIGIIILVISLLGSIKTDGNFSRGVAALFGKNKD